MRPLLEIWDGWPARFRFAMSIVLIAVAIAIVMTVIDLASGRRAHTNDPSTAPAAASGSARS